MKTSKKIMLTIASVIGVVVVAGGIYWFSMPKEQRNMLLFMIGSGEKYDEYQEYQVIDSNKTSINPTSFQASIADSDVDSNNINIVAITGMVKNDTSKMMKEVEVQPTGIADYTGWQLIADEGGASDSNPHGPSPLSYYTAGLASNLHTQILNAANVKGVELDSVKVEVLNTFRWDEMTSADGAGFLDLSSTNIIIESSASEADIQAVKDLAINAWAAGEALRNETVIEPTFVVNGENWENKGSTPGTTVSDVSIVNDVMISQITDEVETPSYLTQTPKDDSILSMIDMSNMQFEIYAISESAGNSARPYLKRVVVSTPTAETWAIYSDEFMGGDDIPVAPTSLEYFTAGTALCLTSQMTLVSAMMDLDFTDYRVEQQIDYRQEGINSVEMQSYADTAHSYVLINSDESMDRLETFYNKSLSLCFAGEGLKNATEMNINTYLNGVQITQE